MFHQWVLFYTLLLCISIVAAKDYKQLYVFGDSLSDSGRIYKLTNGVYPPSPPYNQRVTNKLVWSEYLAPQLGTELNSQNNYAVAGAFSSIGGLDGDFIPGVFQQIDQYGASEASRLDHANDLFVIWSGSNDLFTPLTEGADQATLTAKAIEIVANINQQITKLMNQGVTNIVVIGLIDVSIVPDFKSIPIESKQQISALIQQINAGIINSLSQYKINIAYTDINSKLTKVVTTPENYGLTNVTDACINEKNVCTNPEKYLFWDGKHPTHTGHQIIARHILQSVNKNQFTSSTQQLRLPSVQLMEGDKVQGYYDVILTYQNTHNQFILTQATEIKPNTRLAERSTFDLISNVLTLKDVSHNGGIVNAKLKRINENYDFIITTITPR